MSLAWWSGSNPAGDLVETLALVRRADVGPRDAHLLEPGNPASIFYSITGENNRRAHVVAGSRIVGHRVVEASHHSQEG